MATSRTRGPRKPLIEVPPIQTEAIEVPPIQTEAIVAAQNLGDILSTPEGQALSLKAQEAGRYLGLLESTKAALDVARFEDMAEKAQKIQSEAQEIKGQAEESKMLLSQWHESKRPFDRAIENLAQVIKPSFKSSAFGLVWTGQFIEQVTKDFAALQLENKSLEGEIDSVRLEMSDALKAEKAISAASDKRAEEKAALLVDRDATIASLKSQVEQARNSAGEWEGIATTHAEDCHALASRNITANRLAFALGMLALSGFALHAADHYRSMENILVTVALLAGIAAFIAFGILLLDKLMNGLSKADAQMEEEIQ